MLSEQGIKSAIRSAPTSGKASIELKDDGDRGGGRLMLLIRIKGSGTDKRIISEWYAVWWRGAARKMAKLGAYPAVGLGDARKTFRTNYAPAISKGEEPEKPNARKDVRPPTVGELFKAYVADLKTSGKRTWFQARNVLLGPDEKGGMAKALGPNKIASAVTPDDVVDVLKPIHERGAIVQADRTRNFLSAAFGWAMRSQHSYFTAASGVQWGVVYNPVKAVPVNPEARRTGKRNLSPAELRVFWNWLDERFSDRVGAPALMVIAATGQRVEEILHLTKPGYARDEEMLDWSKTKNGNPHSIPLPRQASDVMGRLVPNPEGLYFPHRRKPTEPASLAALGRLVDEYCKDNDVPHFTPRDLRRTWKTLSGRAGIAKEIRDRIQNHARSDVSSKHYDRYDYLAEKRAAMKVWEAYLDRILTGDLDTEVVPIKKKGAA